MQQNIAFWGQHPIEINNAVFKTIERSARIEREYQELFG